MRMSIRGAQSSVFRGAQSSGFSGAQSLAKEHCFHGSVPITARNRCDGEFSTDRRDCSHQRLVDGIQPNAKQPFISAEIRRASGSALLFVHPNFKSRCRCPLVQAFDIMLNICCRDWNVELRAIGCPLNQSWASGVRAIHAALGLYTHM